MLCLLEGQAEFEDLRSEISDLKPPPKGSPANCAARPIRFRTLMSKGSDISIRKRAKQASAAAASRNSWKN